MTTVQWFGVGLLIVVFFGSISLGRYLRWRDEKREQEREAQRIQVHPLHVMEANGSKAHTEFLYSSHDPHKLIEFMDEYFAEVERLALGYHGKAIMHGEEAAKKWLREQTGQDK